MLYNIARILMICLYTWSFFAIKSDKEELRQELYIELHEEDAV